MIDFIVRSLRELGRKKLRSFLAILGISVGVSAVVIISAIGMGGEKSVSSQLDSLGINGLNISGKANAEGGARQMSDSDLKLCMRTPGVKSAMPLIMQTGSVSACKVYGAGNSENRDALIWGVGPGAHDSVSINVIYGRMFTKGDVKKRAGVCLVDDTFAMKEYKRRNITGKTVSVNINGKSKNFKICGVVESGNSLLYNLIGEYMPVFIYLPYSSTEDMRGTNGFDQIIIRSKPGRNLDVIGRSIINRLCASDATKGSFVASNVQSQRQRLSGMMNVITMIISAIGAVSLVVAGIGIMTVMLVSVNERKREIGIKKAVGAKKSVILLEFLLESLFISAIGGAAGSFAGICTAYFLSSHMKLSFIPDFHVLAGSFLFSLTIGVIFGVYPAYKAANLQPAEALRYE